MAGRTTAMIYDENLASSLVDNQEGGGGGGVGCVLLQRKNDIAFFYGRQTSADYQNVLKSNILPIGKYPRKEKLEIPTG